MNTPDELRLPEARRPIEIDDKAMPTQSVIGTCVEGIRVSFESPGFSGRSLFAIANAFGLGAPRTNVARSALEQTPELQAALLALYRIYARHLASEMEAHQSRGFSITWAVQEAKFIARRLIGGRGREDAPLRPRLLAEALATEVPLLLVELENVRKNVRLNELGGFEKFWTIHGYVFRSAEGFLRELETSASLRAIDGAVGGAGLSLPSEPVLCGDYSDHPLRDLIFAHREPVEIRVSHAQRRIDILWSSIDERDAAQWIRFSAPRDMLRRISKSSRALPSRILETEIWIPKKQFDFWGVQDEEILYADGRLFLRHDGGLAPFFTQIMRSSREVRCRLLSKRLLGSCLG
jgi:molecular chaperone HtpG